MQISVVAATAVASSVGGTGGVRKGADFQDCIDQPVCSHLRLTFKMTTRFKVSLQLKNESSTKLTASST
jgi:hypothetical protein